MTRHRHPRRPPRPQEPTQATELLFCANCQVSVAAVELERGTARRTPRGRIFCPLCTRATPAERTARRRALEVEFADDAPIPGTGRSGAPGAPPATPSLEERVAHLERRVQALERRLAAGD